MEYMIKLNGDFFNNEFGLYFRKHKEDIKYSKLYLALISDMFCTLDQHLEVMIKISEDVKQAYIEKYGEDMFNTSMDLYIKCGLVYVENDNGSILKCKLLK